ncbi:MAG: PEGA domain-containing protein [Pseudomonadota bacterium]
MPDKETKGPRIPVAQKPDEPQIAEPGDRTVIKAEGEIEEATPRRAQYPLPYMIVVDGPRTGSRFPLKDGANIIGRAPGNEIRLEDQSVSRQHAEISKSPSGWFVKDLGSKNGTMVNGKPLTDSVGIGHKDIVKTGIYQLRLITQQTPLEEELTLPPELSMADRTVFVSAPPDGATAGIEKREITEPELVAPSEEPMLEGRDMLGKGPPPGPPRLKALRNTKQIIIIAGLIGIVLISALYFGPRLMKGKGVKMPKKPVAEMPAVPKAAPTKPVTPPTSTPPEAPPPTAGTPPTPGATPAKPTPTAPPVAEPAVKKVPVFLDFASSPMPAEITFQGEKVGTAPLRINVQLEADKTYQADALFDMTEIGQQYTQQAEFKTEIDKSVIPVLFRAPIGMIKVNNLPRDVEFYLEGTFSYNKFKERTAKLNEIILQKPIYIPFGEYKLELRRAHKMGETSPTYVSDIIFRREFNIAEDSPTFSLDVSEEDLKMFPVKVRSEPRNAEVFIDGKVVGRTPFEGNFPLGEHRLVLRKEGYFEHAEDLKVDINTPFVADVKLETSIAGAHINNATLAMNRQLWQEAINELAQALSSNPAPSEIALANYLLGKAYFNMNDLQRAIGYFDQAKQSEEQRYSAMLGLVNCYAIQQQLNKALPLLVEVLLKAKDDEVKREANDLFQKISPFRSVVYVYSDPAGAKVVVNDKEVGQSTPVILHDLPLGSYRIHIEKTGYLPSDLNLSLSVNEFNPVIVKLKPIPE